MRSFLPASGIGVRALLAALALLLGLVAPAHAAPPTAQPLPDVVLPAALVDQPAPVVRVYFIAYRSQVPPAVLLAVRATSCRSAWFFFVVRMRMATDRLRFVVARSGSRQRFFRTLPAMPAAYGRNVCRASIFGG